MDAITIRLYVDANGRVPFEDWLIAFDRSTQSRIEARLARVRTGNLGDHRDLGQGLLELRLFFGAGYRIYLTWDGANVLLLLAGGRKAHRSGTSGARVAT